MDSVDLHQILLPRLVVFNQKQNGLFRQERQLLKILNGAGVQSFAIDDDDVLVQLFRLFTKI